MNMISQNFQPCSQYMPLRYPCTSLQAMPPGTIHPRGARSPCAPKRPEGRHVGKQQRGSTLMVALIMLVLLTLIAVSAINSTNTSTQMVGNAQYREEAGAVAQQAIERIISTDFTAAPAPSVTSVDINNDTRTDYTVSVLKPICISSVADSALCLGSAQQTGPAIETASGVVASSTMLACFKQKWEIVADVSDSSTGANIIVHQGVSTHVETGVVCPP